MAYGEGKAALGGAAKGAAAGALCDEITNTESTEQHRCT